MTKHNVDTFNEDIFKEVVKLTLQQELTELQVAENMCYFAEVYLEDTQLAQELALEFVTFGMIESKDYNNGMFVSSHEDYLEYLKETYPYHLTD